MSTNDHINDERDDELGLAPMDIRWIARRQLVASMAAMIVIAIGVAVATMLPPSHSTTQLAASTVREPTFVAPPNSRFASNRKLDLELP